MALSAFGLVSRLSFGKQLDNWRLYPAFSILGNKIVDVQGNDTTQCSQGKVDMLHFSTAHFEDWTCTVQFSKAAVQRAIRLWVIKQRTDKGSLVYS